MVEIAPVGVLLAPEGTSVKDRLLRAGIRAFAEKGFHGARIEDIISHAGVNVRMVYHYFGSKEGLYDEAVRVASGSLMSAAVTASRQDRVSVITRFEQAVKAYCEACIEQPTYAKLIAWEATRGGMTLRSVVPADESAEQVFLSLLEQSVEEGHIKAPLDSAMVVVALTGAPSFLSHPLLDRSDSPPGEEHARKTAHSFWMLIAGALGI